MTFFARSSEWARAPRVASEGTPFAGGSQHYFAFLSYSHHDEALANWLEDQLERFRVPRHLVGRITDYGAVPRKLTPIFRDVKELPASGDLGTEIKAALSASRFLVVLCSPDAAASRWTNAEVEAFKRTRPDGGVFAAILSGEPFASEIPGREQEECLPHALRFKYDRRGRPTPKKAEPLAADLRGSSDDRRLGFLKLVAGMLGVGLDDLVRRDAIRRQRRLGLLAAGSLAGMVFASALAVTAIQARDSARDQRREAEGLISFMLGDLREKLEPVGRLDALAGVGSRVLDYYKKQDLSQLSEGALSQRSRALSLMGEIANLRGDSAEASRLYQEALAGTREALRRNPDAPQRLFDHAQNVFWIGEIARSSGRLRDAETAYREYKSLAERMVSLEPDNMKWRMETQYADTNLGITLFEQRRFAEAEQQFQRALATTQALATADPANSEYQKGLAETLAWLADAKMASGKIGESIALRQRHVALLNRSLAASNDDVEFRQKLIPAYRALGRAYGSRAEFGPAISNLRLAVQHADKLMAVEPQNSLWIEYAADARLDLALYLLTSGNRAEADDEAHSGCRLASSLVYRNGAVGRWRASRRDCDLMLARLAFFGDDKQAALAPARVALEAAKTAKSGDAIADSFAVAEASQLLGDVYAAIGDSENAKTAWEAGLTQLARDSAERPWEMNIRAKLLQRLGRSGEAAPIAAKLSAMKFKSV